MKRLSLLFATLFCIAGQAFAQEELDLSPSGWNSPSLKVIVTADKQLPATVTLSGANSGNNFVAVSGNIDVAEVESYKIVFGEPISEGTLQLDIRGNGMANTYIPLEGGITEYEGEFDFDFEDDSDRTITRFAIRNNTPNNGGAAEVVFSLQDFIIYMADGTEWHPTLAASTYFSWSTWTNEDGATIIPVGGEEKEVWAFGQWGHLQHDFAEPQVVYPGETHRFTVTLGEAFPADKFHLTVVNGENRIYPLTTEGVEFFPEGTTTAYIDITYPADVENIGRNEAIEYTGVSIQANAAANLPTSIKVTREISGGNRPIMTEALPIKVGGSAEIIDPYPSYDQGENGLPIGVEITGSYGAVGLWNEAFEVGEYIGYKVVLAERPEEGTTQIFFRTETHGNAGGIYLPWETNEDRGTYLSEDGTTLTGEFNIDEFEGDNTVLVFAIQKIADSGSLRCVVKEVYLQNEDEEWIATPGIGHAASSLWNEGKTFAVGGSYDSEGNIYDAYVKFNAQNDYLGAYEGVVEEGTYHKITFYTEEPLPEGVGVVCQNWSLGSGYSWNVENVPFTVEGEGTNALSLKFPLTYSIYDFWGMWKFGGLMVAYGGSEENLPLQVRFTKIVREVYEATPADYAYSIVGDFSSWNSDLYMTPSAATPGVYTLTLTGQQIKEVKAYEYKVRANKNFELYQLPVDGNLDWTPERTGVYDITFTFNLNEGTCEVDAVRTGDCTWTVTFVNALAWDEVNAYTFDPELNGTWPGEAMTFERHSNSLDADIYSYSYTGENAPTNIVFNAGEGKPQTKDFVFEDGKQYTWNSYTVSYVNVEKWGEVHAYTFNDELLNTWPGTLMTLTDEVEDGFSVYTITFFNDVAPANIIFNNGNFGDENQTEDLVFENGKRYRDASKLTTGIDVVKTDVKNAVIFNMAGQRVAKAQKGLYIVNGKKVVVK